MFNRKLKEEVERLEEEIDKKNRYISTLHKKIEKLEEYKSKMPADCVRGNYCEVCGFVKVIHISNGNDYSFTKSFDKLFVCGKGKACPNFVMRNDVKEEE